MVLGTLAYGAPACSGSCATFSGAMPKGTGSLRFSELASTEAEDMERPVADPAADDTLATCWGCGAGGATWRADDGAPNT